VTPDRLAELMFAGLFAACALGFVVLVWTGRERRKPTYRPTVPRTERLPPA
jgi:ABC-type transporter Mla subunit MlaD